MKISKVLLFLVLATLFCACGASNKVKASNPALDEMVASKNFEFRARFAQPMLTNAMSTIADSGLLAPGNTISQIDVTNSANLLRMTQDSIQVNLAYYGERRLGGGYGNDSGIVSNSALGDMEIEKNEKTKGYLLKFITKQQTENLQIIVNIQANLSASVDINSSHRTRIRYLGKVKSLETN